MGIDLILTIIAVTLIVVFLFCLLVVVDTIKTQLVGNKKKTFIRSSFFCYQ